MLSGPTPNPSVINWSFVLYERGADANYVRVHADSLDAPFDINSGAKLQLGSTAKLRTLITYLNIMTDSASPPGAAQRLRTLQHIAATAPDVLTRWAAGYLAGTKDRSLRPMLAAAMQRTYSAAPVTFFTGGGENSFDNFEPWEDSTVPTVAYRLREFDQLRLCPAAARHPRLRNRRRRHRRKIPALPSRRSGAPALSGTLHPGRGAPFPLSFLRGR